MLPKWRIVPSGSRVNSSTSEPWPSRRRLEREGLVLKPGQFHGLCGCTFHLAVSSSVPSNSSCQTIRHFFPAGGPSWYPAFVTVLTRAEAGTGAFRIAGFFRSAGPPTARVADPDPRSIRTASTWGPFVRSTVAEKSRMLGGQAPFPAPSLLTVSEITLPSRYAAYHQSAPNPKVVGPAASAVKGI